jgi:hypothetical protein
MRLSAALVLAALAVLPPSARAVCGAMSCSADHDRPARPRPGRARLDLSMQYADARTPWSLGARSAVGRVPHPQHDEIRTIHRAWTLRGDWDFASRWGAGLSLPYLSRGHDHVERASGEREGVSAQGVGDLQAELRWTAWRSGDETAALVASLAGKFPTGGRGASGHAHGTAAHAEAEVPMQPGSGSYDAIAGLSVSKAFGGSGSRRAAVLHGRASYRRNGGGRAGYGLGDQIDAQLGGDLPAAGPLDLLARVEWRARRRDGAGGTGLDASFTGGEFLYATPGARWHWGKGLSSYALIQLPIMQRVNRLQIVAERLWLFGTAWEFDAPALGG